jgi:hypothetical protein
MSDEPQAPAPPFATLEVVGPAHIRIHRGGSAVEIRGASAAKIATWYEHQLTHGQVFASTYIAGVLHGFSANLEKDLIDIVRTHRPG